MSGYAIDKGQARILETAVFDLVVQSEAESAMIIDATGSVLAHTGDVHDPIRDTISALAAGSFAATRELASVLREPGFHAIHHQGQKSSIYIHSIAENFLVLVIFANRATVGLVKLYVTKMIEEIEPLLRIVSQQGPSSTVAAPPDLDFDTRRDPFAAHPRHATPTASP